MKIVILGTTSTTDIKNIIVERQVNSEVNVYSSISDFIKDASLHVSSATKIDRFIILQSAFENLQMEELSMTLNSFNDYLSAYYPSSKLITVLQDDDMLQIASNSLISENMLNLKLYPLLVSQVVKLSSLSLDELRKIYAVPVKVTLNTEVLEDVINSSDEVQDVEIQKKETEHKSKKRGIFHKLKHKKQKRNKSVDIEKKEILMNPIGQLTNEAIDTDKIIQDSNNVSQLNDEYKQDDNNIICNDINICDSDIKQLNNNKNIVNDDIEYFNDNIKRIDNNLEFFHIIKHVNNDNNIFNNDSKHVNFDNKHVNNDNNIFDNDINQSENDMKNSDNNVKNDSSDSKALINNIRQQSLSDSKNIKSTLENLDKFTDDIKKDNHIVEINISENTEDTFCLDDIEKVEVESNNNDLGDISDILEKFNEVNKPKIIEKIINISDKKTYRNGVRTIIVTGDRRSGITTTSLELAKHFNKEGRTLYVDFDIKNRGFLSYINIADLLNEEEIIHDGLKYLNKTKNLTNLSYKTKLGFESLVSLYGTEIGFEQIKTIQSILSIQNYYETVIVDCPIDYINYLEELSLNSEIVICCDNTITGRINIVLALSDIKSNIVSSSMSRGKYIITRGSENDFINHMNYIKEIFNLEDENISEYGFERSYDWTSLSIINISNGIEALTSLL
ncbi:hypothetical protein [Clostridioides difficile]|uniref:hypothetical protein n=1 Tax=Clostridioides difficile TaxID=1496 RepID=UPI000D1D876D|nr:hypothetical protein [Clostridioides difficile]HBE9444529.1 hypothetical protein [Clostridioides difficile]